MSLSFFILCNIKSRGENVCSRHNDGVGVNSPMARCYGLGTHGTSHFIVAATSTTSASSVKCCHTHCNSAIAMSLSVGTCTNRLH